MNHAKESHESHFFRFFVEARFVEIQKLCYHGNVAQQLLLPIAGQEGLSEKTVITLTFTNDRIPSKFIDMHLMKCLKVHRYLWEIRRMDNMTFFRLGI